ncbi:MAG: FAD-dependent oxidoreductase, partial [Pseudomonadales bacterium]
MTQRFSTDVLIIGGGAAGLSAALHLAEHARVTVLCKGGMESASSHWAQGGVASVSDPEDSVEAHVRDTLVAGAGLCDEEIVRETVRRGPRA